MKWSYYENVGIEVTRESNSKNEKEGDAKKDPK
jgi:hypothetical protein